MEIPVRGALAAVLILLCAGCASHRIRTDDRAAPGLEEKAARTGGAAAAEWLAETLKSEDGTIRPDGLRLAREHRRMSLTESAGPLASGGLSGWTSRGPTNVGGRTRSLVIHPTTPDTMWAGAVSGGVWKTVDGGASWFPLDDSMGNLAVVTLAMDPNDADTLYAGTGEGFASGLFEPRGEGVFKTTDGGATWTSLASTSNWRMVHKVVVHPTGTVFAAVSDGVGVMRSIDGGATWTTSLSALEAWDLEIDPNDSDRMVFAGSRFVAALGIVSSVWYTTDAGASWARTSHPPILSLGWRSELAWAPSVPGRLFMTEFFRTLLRSDDGGVTFVEVTDDVPTDWGTYYNTLWAHPTDADFLIAGAVDLWRSVDGGVQWTKISDWSRDTVSAHADHHLIVPHPDFDGVTNKTVFDCSDGGIAKAEDITTVQQVSGWTILETGYTTTQFYGADGLGWNGRVYGGTQDNGSLYAPQSTTEFIEPFGGDGGFSRLDYLDEAYCYGEFQNLGVHRSSDGCQTSVRIDSALDNSGANFIAPLELDPVDPHYLYVGSGQLYRTADARAEPEPVWNEIRAVNTAPTSAIAISRSDPGVVWIGQNDGVVEKTADARVAAPTWTAIDDNGGFDPLPDRYIHRILIDRQDPSRVYVGLGGYEPDNLWFTSDGGNNWTDLSGSGFTALPPAPVRGIEQHPCNPDWLYVGTDVGVYVSEDGGANWSTTNEGPADVTVHELRFMAESGRLLAATYGRGLWEATASSVGPDLDGDGLDDACDPDDDGDRVDDIADCAPTDPAYSAVPGESTGLRVDRSGGASLSWNDGEQAERWDVVGQRLSLLRSESGVGTVDCLADDLAAPNWLDPRADPPSGDGDYYLVRAQNPCGDGELGQASGGAPRTPAGGCP